MIHHHWRYQSLSKSGTWHAQYRGHDARSVRFCSAARLHSTSECFVRCCPCFKPAPYWIVQLSYPLPPPLEAFELKKPTWLEQHRHDMLHLAEPQVASTWEILSGSLWCRLLRLGGDLGRVEVEDPHYQPGGIVLRCNEWHAELMSSGLALYMMQRSFWCHTTLRRPVQSQELGVSQSG